jgi:hypothetical protein
MGLVFLVAIVVALGLMRLGRWAARFPLTPWILLGHIGLWLSTIL